MDSQHKQWLNMPYNQLRQQYPYADQFFQTMGLSILEGSHCVEDYVSKLAPQVLEDIGIERSQLGHAFISFLENMNQLQQEDKQIIESVTILGGTDKEGRKENLHLTLRPGDIVAIVGPTGSGKSRLLADIEWMAQGDTPTGRQVLINGKAPEPEKRFAVESKLVAQLSQNMNFVMDLSVAEFISLHAESRLNRRDDIIEKVLEQANKLAGEPFTADTPLTSLSGGQSRALMIADTALLSRSPIVLIDEIENAGVDRQEALQVLVGQDKIVLMATHDPILALMAQRRLIIEKGSVKQVIETTDEEQKTLQELLHWDQKLMAYRNHLRKGKKLLAFHD
ncbi:ATP-binding cassette domain-containing protein [Heliorestis convoluta]|uniref:ABC transporter ATP-binding protein n=1 Tax=Heliorestis convoluta TaxID=356322 RepID=A0A5Q2MWE9_9FIRM|nr:ATP-binding cassette domain-containing protein [Heliorestis convoluta]QGG46794.1 ABC transporter ATP-binding protein [Heliorestis convoluta]